MVLLALGGAPRAGARSSRRRHSGRSSARGWGSLHAISKVTTPIFMGIVYFLVILPIGLVRRLTGNSPILPRGRAASRWDAHVPAVADAERMERQF